ncbi:MAG TPA: fibronectin type III domain-containing protein [Chryseosolibacter sp.]
MASLFSSEGNSQIDTTLIYNPAARFGPLDIRIAKSPTDYYFLETDKTFSYREVNGQKTNSYLDMTAWDSSPYKQGMMLETINGSVQFVMNYRLLEPSNYDKNYNEGYPLVLVLHGLSERGNCAGSDCYHGTTSYSPNVNLPKANSSNENPLLNNDYNLVHGGSNYLEAHRINGNALPDDPALPARGYPGFVLFPQNLNGWDGAAAADAIRLVRLMLKKYNIDPNRVYINGVSNGGHGAYEAMLRAPWLFAAGALFSAADDAGITANKWESDISGIPLWIFQGGVDKKPTPKQTAVYVDKFRKAGTIIRYTLYEQLGHGTWNKAFSEPDFFSWMLGNRNSNIDVFADQPIVCKTNGKGSVLSLPKGYRAYEWEHNGVKLENEKGFQILATIPGNYRGRILDQEKNSRWSKIINVVEKNPEPVALEQLGTVLLKDPNGTNEATLITSASHHRYQWFKNGVQIDLPGLQDDTLHTAKLKSNLGDGMYSVTVSDYDNCPSKPSPAKYVYFSDRAPLSIEPPQELTLLATSPSEVLVSWDDASENESGFEIWRRSIGTETTTPWSLVRIAAMNEISYSDKGLVPSKKYEYIIRAISTSGRSPYTTAQTVSTPLDGQAPSAPTDLTVNIASYRTLKLNWKPANDNSSILQYIVHIGNDTLHTGSSDTTFILDKFILNQNYTFQVRAIDAGGNTGALSNSASIFTKVEGLFYQHSTGDWNNLDEVDWNIAEFTGVVNDFSLTPKTQDDYFNFRFDGYLNIVKDGIYQFRLSSNDGSRMFFEDTLLINNDGIHNLATVTAPIQLLPSGFYAIRVDFFDQTLTDTLAVEYKGPDSNGEWMTIPADKLNTQVVTSTEDDVEDNFDFDVFPNPVINGRITVKFHGSSVQSVAIVSAEGRIVYNQDNSNFSEGTNELTFDASLLRDGIYFIKAIHRDVVKTKKIIVRQ